MIYLPSDQQWGSDSEDKQIHRHLPSFIGSWKFDYLQSHSTIRFSGGVCNKVEEKLRKAGCAIRHFANYDMEADRPSHWTDDAIGVRATLWWLKDDDKECICHIKFMDVEEIGQFIADFIETRDGWTLAVETEKMEFTYVCPNCDCHEGHEQWCKHGGSLVREFDVVHVPETAESCIMGTKHKTLTITRIDVDGERNRFFGSNGVVSYRVQKGAFDQAAYDASWKMFAEKMKSKMKDRNS